MAPFEASSDEGRPAGVEADEGTGPRLGRDQRGGFVRPPRCAGDLAPALLGSASSLLSSPRLSADSSASIVASLAVANAGARAKRPGGGALEGSANWHKSTSAASSQKSPSVLSSPCSDQLEVSEYFGSGNVSAASAASAASSAGGGLVRPKLRKSGTQASAGSVMSVRSIRARETPRLRRCVTGVSVQTKQSEASVASSAVEGMGFDFKDLRSTSCVPVTHANQWPVQDIYKFETLLGQGSFGSVWLASNHQTNERWAIKCLSVKQVPDPERMESEMLIFARLRNPYIVCLHEVYKDKANLYLVMDLCLGGDLCEYVIQYWSKKQDQNDAMNMMHICGGLPWKEVPKLLWQMLAALSYLHYHRFVHRDIKLENFMIKERDGPPQIQLVDFGLSTRLVKGEPMSGAVGSLIYVAPEVLTGEYTEKCDIWSVGVSAYMLCVKSHPWGDDGSEQALAQAIISDLREGWPERTDKPPQLRDLVDSMMTYDPNERPSAKSLLSDSSWLARHGAPDVAAPSCCAIT